MCPEPRRTTRREQLCSFLTGTSFGFNSAAYSCPASCPNCKRHHSYPALLLTIWAKGVCDMCFAYVTSFHLPYTWRLVTIFHRWGGSRFCNTKHPVQCPPTGWGTGYKHHVWSPTPLRWPLWMCLFLSGSLLALDSKLWARDHMHSHSVLPLSPFPTWTYQHPLQLEGGSLSRRSSGKAELLPPLSPSKDTSGSGSEWIYAALVVLFPSSIRGTLLNSTPLNSFSSFWSPVPWYCLLLLPYCMCPDKGFFLFSLCLSIWAQQDWATLTSFSTIHCLPCWKNLISIPDNPTFSQSLDHGLME